MTDDYTLTVDDALIEQVALALCNAGRAGVGQETIASLDELFGPQQADYWRKQARAILTPKLTQAV